MTDPISDDWPEPPSRTIRILIIALLIALAIGTCMLGRAGAINAASDADIPEGISVNG